MLSDEEITRWQAQHYLTPSHSIPVQEPDEGDEEWELELIPGPTFDRSLWQQQATLLVKAANLIPGMFWLTITISIWNVMQGITISAASAGQ